MTSAFPARSAMWRYKGTPFSAAPALHTARDTPKMALAPNLAAIERNCLQKCYIFIKRLSTTSTTILVAVVLSTAHCFWQGKLEFYKPIFIFSHLTATQSPLTFVLSSIHFQHQFVNLFLLHNADILQREESKALLDTKHELSPTHCIFTSLTGTKNCSRAATNSWRAYFLSYHMAASSGHFQQTKADR